MIARLLGAKAVRDHIFEYRSVVGAYGMVGDAPAGCIVVAKLLDKVLKRAFRRLKKTNTAVLEKFSIKLDWGSDCITKPRSSILLNFLECGGLQKRVGQRERSHKAKRRWVFATEYV